MLPKERVARLGQGLVEARETISPYYDDVFREVQQRVSADGSAGKANIAMLIADQRDETPCRGARCGF
jgi:hypothetical protein